MSSLTVYHSVLYLTGLVLLFIQEGFCDTCKYTRYVEGNSIETYFMCSKSQYCCGRECCQYRSMSGWLWFLICAVLILVLSLCYGVCSYYCQKHSGSNRTRSRRLTTIQPISVGLVRSTAEQSYTNEVFTPGPPVMVEPIKPPPYSEHDTSSYPAKPPEYSLY
ncbi:uncharacterized protein [Ptychodera flava]|uniref:uncharacterized protein n=1 Tax=Ptychodera flava TaxID=63121 RepID=UPI003969FF7A